MPNKSHKNVVKYHQEILEGHPFRFNCKREFNVVRGGRIHSIDLGCFREEANPLAIGLEAESSSDFSPQVLSNKKDLEIFQNTYKNSRVFQIKTDERIDFEKEFSKKENNCKRNLEGECINENHEIKQIEKEKKVKFGLPKTRIALGW